MTCTTRQELCDQLRSLNVARGSANYRRSGLAATCDHHWIAFTTPVAKGSRPVRQLGLWKPVRTPSGKVRREFHVPLQTVLCQDVWDDESGEAMDALAATVHWARSTAQGDLPPDWQAPPRNELEALLPKDALTVQAGPFVRQGQLRCEASWLTISYPLRWAVPHDLPSARRAWLDTVLADAQDRCRLVRFVEREAESSTTNVSIEVDLSGVPRFAIPELVRCAIAAARRAVSQFVWIVELLVDPAVKATVWEFPPEQVKPAERGQS